MFGPTRHAERKGRIPTLDPLCQLALARQTAGAFFCSQMTSANSLFLILRRLDEIERKLDRILEELTRERQRAHVRPPQWRTSIQRPTPLQLFPKHHLEWNLGPSG
jgi:hypothetical protein